MRTRVKICGITRSEDAALAVALGASALGFIFCPSVRKISVNSAQRIVASLPPYLDRVGVFVDASAREIQRVIRQVGLSRVQLHGNETPEWANEIPCALTRTLSWDDRDHDEEMARWRAQRPDVHFLLDLPKSDPIGTLPRLSSVAELCCKLPITLAGGLDADSVLLALEHYRPAAVDVARGVEVEPGIKDPDKLRAFFRSVNAFDAVRGREPGEPAL